MHEEQLVLLKRQLRNVEQRLNAQSAAGMGLELLELSAEMGCLAAGLLAESAGAQERMLAMDTQLRMMETFCQLNRGLQQELSGEEAQVQARAEATRQELLAAGCSLKAAVQEHHDRLRQLQKTRQQLKLATLQVQRGKWAKPVGDD